MRRSSLLALVASIAVVVSLTAGASATGPGGWDHLGDAGTPGSASLNAKVSVLSTDAPERLLVGGTFDNAGGVDAADRLASWNGSTWSAVAPGLTGEVRAIAYKDGKVFVGGTFTGPGGVEDRNNLAVWDGANWGTACSDTAPGPAFGGNVNDLQIIGSTLWVGGAFQNGAHIPEADYLLAAT